MCLALSKVRGLPWPKQTGTSSIQPLTLIRTSQFICPVFTVACEKTLMAFHVLRATAVAHGTFVIVARENLTMITPCALLLGR